MAIEARTMALQLSMFWWFQRGQTAMDWAGT